MACESYRFYSHYWSIYMLNKNSVVAIYDEHAQAEAAVKLLQKEGIDMNKLSIVGQGYHSEENVVGYYTAGDRMMHWGKNGAFWGGMWGMLFGSAFFMVPGVGPIMAAGPIVAWIVGALESAVLVGGISAVGAGLYSIDIPKKSVLKYETSLKAGKQLLVLHGTPEEVTRAHGILATTGASETQLHLSEVPELV
jgi:hypothetical protein